jgi:hypothetical protein
MFMIYIFLSNSVPLNLTVNFSNWVCTNIDLFVSTLSKTPLIYLEYFRHCIIGVSDSADVVSVLSDMPLMSGLSTADITSDNGNARSALSETQLILKIL